MAKLFKSKKLKLIAATSVAIFNLLAIFSGVGAWFTSITKTDQDTDQIDISNLVGVQIVDNKWDIYGFDLENDIATVSSDDYVLGDYDAFIPVRNVHCRRTIHLKLEYPGGVTANKALKIEIAYSGAYKSGDEIQKNISNLVEFKYFVNDGTIDASDTTTQSAIETTYYALQTKFDSITTYDTFVNASTKVKANICNTSAIPLAESATSYQTDLFIQYNYNEELTTQFNDNYGAFDISFFDEGGGSEKVKFSPDITKIRFSVGDYTGA